VSEVDTPIGQSIISQAAPPNPFLQLHIPVDLSQSPIFEHSVKFACAVLLAEGKSTLHDEKI
jgi:hypothetical protein